jgi:hypothetical protein
LSSGQSYQFYYRGKNVFGWGLASPILTMTAMNVPTTPVSVTTTMSGTSVMIAWTAPYSGGSGITITSYDILIQKSDATFISYSACDGTTSTVIANLYCLIPMSDITGTTFGLS